MTKLYGVSEPRGPGKLSPRPATDKIDFSKTAILFGGFMHLRQRGRSTKMEDKAIITEQLARISDWIIIDRMVSV